MATEIFQGYYTACRMHLTSSRRLKSSGMVVLVFFRHVDEKIFPNSSQEEYSQLTVLKIHIIVYLLPTHGSPPSLGENADFNVLWRLDNWILNLY